MRGETNKISKGIENKILFAFTANSYILHTLKSYGHMLNGHLDIKIYKWIESSNFGNRRNVCCFMIHNSSIMMIININISIVLINIVVYITYYEQKQQYEYNL